MLRKRIIPILLLDNNNLVKTYKFQSRYYLGDPLNSVRIFNEKEVDELAFLDISLNRFNNGPNFKIIEDIASEAFMPLSYGGGISNINEIKNLLTLGIEKLIISTFAIKNKNLVNQASEIAGSSSIIISLDINKNKKGEWYLTKYSGQESTLIDPLEYALEMEKRGAGELLINCIYNDGVRRGYDLELIKKISSIVSIPVIIVGGAGTLNHLKDGIISGASAVGAGSLFVLYGKYNAVLINYPSQIDLKNLYELDIK